MGRKTALSAMALVSLCISPVALATILINESIDYYQVNPRAGESIQGAAMRSKPLCGDKHALGCTYSSYRFKYSYIKGVNGCRIEKLTVTLEIKMVLPELGATAEISDEERAAFSAMQSKVALHEQAHRGIAVAGAQEMEDALSSLDVRWCRTLEQEMKRKQKEIMAKYKARQQGFDRKEARR